MNGRAGLPGQRHVEWELEQDTSKVKYERNTVFLFLKKRFHGVFPSCVERFHSRRHFGHMYRNVVAVAMLV